MSSMKATVHVIALLLGMDVGVAQAAPVAWTGSLGLYDSNGGYVGGTNDVTGYIDQTAGTFSLASNTPFYGYLWSTSGGTLFGPGSYSHSTVDPDPGVSGGDYNFTVGSGQLGAVVDFAWAMNTGMDVLMIWNVATAGGITTYTMTDPDGDGVPGTPMIDGPFVGFSANFNMQHPVPVPAAVWLLGSGLLGLAGFARRKKIV